MQSSTTEAEEIARLALGGRALKNRRIRRALLARLINENGESHEGEEEEGGYEEEGGGDEHELVRALIASRFLRRRRVRRAVLAHLLRERSEYEAEGDEGDGDTGEEGEGDDHELVRALVASRILRRRRVRRAILVHLLRTKGEHEEDGGDGEDEEGGSDEDRDLVRVLVASRLLKRRRVRRALLTHFLREEKEGAAV